jgi:hypothetical protein
MVHSLTRTQRQTLGECVSYVFSLNHLLVLVRTLRSTVSGEFLPANLRSDSPHGRIEMVHARGRARLVSRPGNCSHHTGARSTAINGYSERFAQLVHPCAREAPNPISEEGGGN